MEFTYLEFSKILMAFIENKYSISPVNLYNTLNTENILILRHDVDRYPNQTVQMARLESKMGVRSTYYFRTVNSVFKEEILREVVSLGHEIGYHYEDLALCKGNYVKAIESFKKNLEKVRKYYPVKTICMHGSPLSPWDNKKLWTKYEYKEYGILIDTSLDFDYNEIFYITDNGFGWNKTNTSVRDKVKSKFNILIDNTSHFIELLNKRELPQKIMLNAHPDTFFNPGIRWVLNFSVIKSKNLAKWIIVKSKIIR